MVFNLAPACRVAGHVIGLIPSPRDVQRAAENLTDRVLQGRFADVDPMPSTTVHSGPQCHVIRYVDGDPKGEPVLFIPPLAAPAFVYDMRRGCSFAEYMIGKGHDTYLVDYGPIGFNERHIGLEHWIHSIIPDAVRVASKKSGGRNVHLVCWSLGGALAASSIAADPKLPVASLSMIGTPLDTGLVPMVSLARPIVELTGGVVGTALYRAFGIAPGAIVKRIYQLATFDKYITKPIAVLQNLGDRDSLEQIEQVDRMMNGMTSFSGRALGQIYHDFLRLNDFEDGKVSFGGPEVDLRDIDVAVLSIAGADDGLAPVDSVHHVADIIDNVQLETVPGGHLGILSGRGAIDTTWPLVESFITAHAGARRS
jgi:polyhydroxyalkanoate synthase